MRIYFSPIVGDGLTPETAIRPAIAEMIEGGFSSLEGKNGMWVHADATPDEHAKILAVSGVQYLPLDDADGRPVGWSEPLSLVAAANRAVAMEILDAHHVPLGGIGLDDPVRRVVRRLHRRMLMRQFAEGVDLDDFNLDATIASIPVARRQAWAARLRERGVDLSGLSGTSTLRDALIAAGRQLGKTAAG